MQFLKHFFTSKKVDLNKYFRQGMFWDVNINDLSVKRDKWFIIDRILSLNLCNPVYLDNLEKFYKIQDIKKVAVSSIQIRGNKTIEFLADRYDLNPEQFKNYITDI